jgi:predicted GNAT family acetyltransferase
MPNHTLPPFRRKGCASKALAAWTTALLQEKTVPLYSALIENNSSQQLAKKSGWTVYGYGLSIYDKI